VLSGRGFCDELITRPEESYKLWCVVVCDLETSRMKRPWPALGRSATKKKVYYKDILYFLIDECYIRSVKIYSFIRKYAVVPVQLEIVILQYIDWCVFIIIIIIIIIS
jgi:hypothetical protein